MGKTRGPLSDPWHLDTTRPLPSRSVFDAQGPIPAGHTGSSGRAERRNRLRHPYQVPALGLERGKQSPILSYPDLGRRTVEAQARHIRTDADISDYPVIFRVEGEILDLVHGYIQDAGALKPRIYEPSPAAPRLKSITPELISTIYSELRDICEYIVERRALPAS